jgi:NAD(P)-dependent dehydrogenase (short-subunit alcohol dehydrogenase family)
MLKNKVAVVYGAGGGIGGAVAKVFARNGARVFLTDRSLAEVESVGREIAREGGKAEWAEVDALDEPSIEKHIQSVVQAAGQVDISMNAVGTSDQSVLGIPAVDLGLEQFLRPLKNYATTYFLTARHAARHMIPRRTGVIMTVSALHSRIGIPLVGGYGPAQAAKESLTRHLSAELAPHGIRVVGLRPQAMLETRTIRDAYEPRAKATGLTWEDWQKLLATRTHGRRLMTLDEMANLAAFAASDQGSGLTGTTINLTMGSLDD